MERVLDKISNLLYFYKSVVILFSVAFLFFQEAITRLSGIPSYIDELILVAILLFGVYKSFDDIVIKRLVFLYFFSFFTYFLMSYQVIGSRGLITVILQIFIHLKYILFVIFFWGVIGSNNSIKVIHIGLFITILFMVINLLSGSLFNQMFDVKMLMRGGLMRPIGIQADTGSLGTTFALLGAFYLSAFRVKNKEAKIGVFIVFICLILLASTRTSLILIPLIILWWLKDSLKSFFIAVLFLSFFSLFFKSSSYVDDLIKITVENIESTIDDPVKSSYIRGIMIYFSFELATDRFPLGTGAATYGTVLSENSHVYAEIGLHNSVYFIDTTGIYDSNLASILGEFGYIGLFLYLFIFYKVLQAPRLSVGSTCESEFKFVFYLLILTYALTTPVFMSTYPAFLIGLCVVASYYQTVIDKKS